MKLIVLKLILLINVLMQAEAAKILAAFTCPSISHQVVFRPYTQELAKRGHEVLVVTTEPAFPIGGTPANLSEIDIHDLLYGVLKKHYNSFKIAEETSMYSQFDAIYALINDLTRTFIKSDIVNKLRENKYDLLITEALHPQVLLLSHILKIPVMQISSFGSTYNYETVGATSHPYLYPEIATQRINNLSDFEKFHESFVNVVLKNLKELYDKEFDKLLRNDGLVLPSVNEVSDKVNTLLLNILPMWEENRPVPIGVSYISGVHRWPKRSMSEEIEKFINSSRNGVIYVSLGTNVHPSMLPKDRMQVIINSLAKIPFDVLLKWDQDELPGKPKNVMISKWFPQIAILSHPNVKLFITQGGLQSTEEAIDAGIPLIGISLLFDQWTNVEKYVRHKIGLKLEIETLTEEKFIQAVNTVLGDKSYRENMIRFRTLMRDQPHKPLDLAIWWTEYAIRYSGAPHLRSAAANMPWTQYYELELLCIVSCTVVIGLLCVGFLCRFILREIVRFCNVSRKKVVKDE